MAHAHASTVVAVDADTVWALLRDFASIPRWYQGASESAEIEDGRAGDQVSAVRVLNDGQIRETLLAHSDLERSYSYSTPEHIFPVKNYVGTMRVSPVTDRDASFVEWTATFDAAWDEVDHWQDHITEVFQAGLAALRSRWPAGDGATLS